VLGVVSVSGAARAPNREAVTELVIGTRGAELRDRAVAGAVLAPTPSWAVGVRVASLAARADLRPGRDADDSRAFHAVVALRVRRALVAEADRGRASGNRAVGTGRAARGRENQSRETTSVRIEKAMCR